MPASPRQLAWQALAQTLVAHAHRAGHAAMLCDLAAFDADEFAEETDDVCVFLLATYERGAAPANATWFANWLDDTARYDRLLLLGTFFLDPPRGCRGVIVCQPFLPASRVASDFRVDREQLRRIRFAVLALGDSLYGEHYATFGKTVHRQLQHLGSVAGGGFFFPPVCRMAG